MSGVEIEHVHTRYHLAPSAGGHKARLDRVLANVLYGALEPALARSGVPSEEEICIRGVDIAVRVKLSSSDFTLESAWSAALAETIRRAIAEDAEVVRYRSRAAAIWDMTRSVVLRDYSRSWAWRQLDLWTAGDAPTIEEASREWTRVLAGYPQTIVPVMQSLAGGHDVAERRAESFLVRLQIAQWVALAKAALRVAGGQPEWIDAASQPGISETSAIPRRATAVWPLVRRGLLQGVAKLPEGRYALATLMLLTGNPEVFHASAAQGRGLLDSAASALYEPLPRSRDGAESPRDPEADAACALEAREARHTEFGGLLYLIRLLETSGILMDLMRLPDRPLRWTLHQLAMSLTGAEENDVAALAFAGLGPEAAPPSREMEPITGSEAAWLELQQVRVREALVGALDDPEISPDQVVSLVFRRPAEILADPGWIDARFSLDHVSTAIRRAGLDLDPGYIRWLGVVVRFLYE